MPIIRRQHNGVSAAAGRQVSFRGSVNNTPTLVPERVRELSGAAVATG